MLSFGWQSSPATYMQARENIVLRPRTATQATEHNINRSENSRLHLSFEVTFYRGGPVETHSERQGLCVNENRAELTVLNLYPYTPPQTRELRDFSCTSTSV